MDDYEKRKKKAYEIWLHARHLGDQWEAIETLIKIYIEEAAWKMTK